jgi:hypothetical protein
MPLTDPNFICKTYFRICRRRRRRRPAPVLAGAVSELSFRSPRYSRDRGDEGRSVSLVTWLYAYFGLAEKSILRAESAAFVLIACLAYKHAFLVRSLSTNRRSPETKAYIDFHLHVCAEGTMGLSCSHPINSRMMLWLSC